MKLFNYESFLSLNENASSGKGVFTSFLKVITALGLKNSQPNWEKCPADFLMFYYYQDLDSQSVKQLFERFKSLVRYSGMIDYDKNTVNLYYGVRCDGIFEYGIVYDSRIIMGQFKLTQSVIKSIVHMDVVSAASLKKEMVNLNYNDILILGKIKNDMSSYDPGYHSKKAFITINDKVISFGYYGLSKWENEKIDQTEFNLIKDKFMKWVLSKKWGSKVLVSMTPNSFWINILIKIK
jgi:hypothetical protein